MVPLIACRFEVLNERVGFWDLFRRSGKASDGSNEGAESSAGTLDREAWKAMSRDQRSSWLRSELQDFVEAHCNDGELFKHNPRKQEFRALYQGRPVTITVDIKGRCDVRLGAVNRRGYFSLRDATLGDDIPPADSGHVGDTDYVSMPMEGPLLVGFKAHIAEDARTFEGLPGDIRQRITQAFDSGLVKHFAADAQWVECEALLGPEHGRQISAGLSEALGLLNEVAEALAQGPTPLPMRPRIVMHGRFVEPEGRSVSCSYCQTRYVLAQGDDHRCPNCGAPLQA